MKQQTALTVLLLSVMPLLWTACGSGETGMVRLNDGIVPGAPTLYYNVLVFTSRAIGREVVELGSVCVTTRSEWPPEEYLSRIRKEAAAIGADAVVGYEIMDGTATGVAVRYQDRNR